MKSIKKFLKLDRYEYYKKHLLIINNFLPIQITNKEIEVLASFMALEGDLKSNPFCTSGRKIIMERLNLSPGGLGNYLDKLEKKQLIYKENNIVKILPILIPEDTLQN